MGTPRALIGRPPGLLVQDPRSGLFGQRRVGAVGLRAAACLAYFFPHG